MSVSKKKFGSTVSGQEATLYIIKDKSGMSVKVSDFGATVVSVTVPDRDGNEKDVVLGYDSVTDYEKDSSFLGACVGRCANRIKDGELLVNGKRFILNKNEGNNSLHSGPDTYNKRMWNMVALENNSVTFELISPNLDQGFPGELILKVKYSIAEGKRFVIEYTAESDADTVMNFTNHSYFNLKGHGQTTVLDQFVWVNANEYTPTDEELIPTGDIAAVAETPFDFTSRKQIGTDINAATTEGDIIYGYDLNYVLNKQDDGKDCGSLAANMYSSDTGILMNVYTDLPGLQLYTPVKMDITGKEGVRYEDYPAVCFETQYFPDAVHQPGFESPIVRSGEEYYSKTIYEFETVEV